MKLTISNKECRLLIKFLEERICTLRNLVFEEEVERQLCLNEINFQTILLNKLRNNLTNE